MTETLSAVNTVLLIINLLVVACGVILTLKHFRLARTWSYIERYNSNDMLKPRLAVSIFLKDIEGLGHAEVTKKIDKIFKSGNPSDAESRIHIETFINLFTELGVAYRASSIDKEAFRALSSLVPRYWHKLEPYITYWRKEVHPYKIHDSFEYLSKHIEDMKLD